ncbi:mandelate racemase/muconate lactonizing enzyme family protein [Jiangella asiatica]|uniref:Mandelate racemase/muconate lactonizing enzyme family protein n=1 Tax=Jiangella asiatica TaxID=2530372 RepID=A0A4R5DRW2_9ACTN|nr:mandelate racemase/muconate lactonizing enzyme family protein [Jiangella asiatica]TDE15064.1 mandelate racemase/muconate lactonizing enzyme family protein [Jiangella asiatica]
MKVTSVETFVLGAAPEEVYWGARTWSATSGRPLVEYPPEARRRYVYSDTIDTVLVRVATADGAVGWGESKAPVGARATAAIVDDLLAPLVVGTRLDEITATWERMYAGMRVRGHDTGFWLEALAGVDIALWDAWGRTLGQPLSALLGGRFRDTVPVYASGVPGAPAGSGEAGQEQVRAEASRLRERGFGAVKVAIGVAPADDVASVGTVRSVFGPDASVFADAAGQYELPQALRVGRALAELDAGFFEMPLPPEDIDGYARLAAALDLPLALDSLATRHRALQFLRTGGLHVLQPDVCRAGGITETMRIAALADAFGAQATPHVSIGSPIHVAASVQCAAAMPNFSIMEFWVGTNPLAVIAPDALAPSGSAITVPTGPGLGVTVDESAVRTLAATSSK